MRSNSKHQNDIFIFYIDSNMINNELNGLNCLLLLVRAVAGLPSPNQNSQKHGAKIIGPCRPCQEVVPLYIGYLTTVFLFFYTDKNTDHARILNTV